MSHGSVKRSWLRLATQLRQSRVIASVLVSTSNFLKVRALSERLPAPKVRNLNSKRNELRGQEFRSFVKKTEEIWSVI